MFGRVSGDSAAAYLLQNAKSSSDTATSRLGAVANHVLEAKVAVDPHAQKVNVEFSWAGASSGSGSSSSTHTPGGGGSGFNANVPATSSSPPNQPSSKAAEAPTKDPNAQQPATAAAPSSSTSSDSSSSADKKPAASSAGGQKEYTAEEVAKHNTKDDCWVIVEGKVLDVTSFLEDHPGGAKAILLYAGRDATEEFLMLHDPKVRLNQSECRNGDRS